MSIATEITRLQTAKVNIASAIADKGVTVPDGTKLDSMADLIAEITTGFTPSEIPEYVKNAALIVAEKVKAKQVDGSVTFLIASDSHQLSSNSNIVNGNTHAGMAMKIISSALNLDFAAFLGDYTAGSSTTTIAEGKDDFAKINRYIDEAFRGLPQFRTVGNHDPLGYSYSQNGVALTPAELFVLIGSYNEGATYGSTVHGYCYRDFLAKKLRVICLNTAEAETYTGSAESISSTQLAWFKATLESTPTNYGIIILSHHPLDWGSVCQASNTLKTYMDGTSHASYVIALHGHIHGYKVDKLNYISGGAGTPYNVKRIAVPNMCFARNNEYGQNTGTEYYGIEFGETKTYNKTADSAEDTAFCVGVLIPSEEKVYMYHYGAGYDREVFYGEEIIAVTGITLDQTSGTLTEGSSVVLTATVYPSDASDKTIIWSTSNSTVATVSDGTVTAIKAGTATITAKTQDGNFTATYSLTVKAVPVSYTNMIPTAQAVGSTAPYNGTGYCDGKYLSSGASPWEGSDSACVLTGNIPYVIQATGLPKTIYIKGAAWEAISHCRLYFFTESKNSICGPMITGNGSGNGALSKYYTIETLGDNYIKLTPIASDNGTNSMLVSTVASASNAQFVRFSLKGTGANLIITLDEPIE